MFYPQLRLVCCLGLSLGIFGATVVDKTQAETPPQILGLRNATLTDKDSATQTPHLPGRILFNELNCVACHASEVKNFDSPKQAPHLKNIAERVNPYFLEKHIAAPHMMKPGSLMPNVYTTATKEEKKQSVAAITQYLLSQGNPQKFKLKSIDHVAADKGRELFHTIGCVACHAPRDDQDNPLLSDQSVPLPELEKKYHLDSLTQFLLRPHNTRPSGRMPDFKLNSSHATQLANYLLKKTQMPGHLKYTMLRGRVWEGLAGEEVSAIKGGLIDDFELSKIPQLQHNSAIIYEGYLHTKTAGEHEFLLKLNGGSLSIDDQKIIDLAGSSRRGVKQVMENVKLQPGWHKLKLIYLHVGREPSFQFEVKFPGENLRAPTANELSISDTPIAEFTPYTVDQSLVAQGKAEFSARGCANCHQDVQATRQSYPSADQLNLSAGCLSQTIGNWPDYHLNEEQQEALRLFLKIKEIPKLKPQHQIDLTLSTLNCIACHQREGLGKVSDQRNQYFTGTKKELGNQGRIPPPLTLVGAKLPQDWLKEVLENGQQQREYLNTRMPKFGAEQVSHLVDLFEKVDHVEPVKFAPIDDLARYKAAGHLFMGTTGFSCIACHDFNGQKAAGPGAMELIHTTQRLKKDWYYHFMINPAHFRPNIIMPTSWPNGYVFKKDILDGDAKKQIESLWIYLEDGRRAKNPIGLSRKSPELRVTDRALICRGRGPAGYRGIAVGYPKRVNLAFDSLEMNLKMLWQEDFTRVDPGRFSVIGTNRIEFPPGIPFHRLESLDEDWPYKQKTDYLFPQRLGYRFKGYYLDSLQRPTFMYDYGEIAIEEFFTDKLDKDGNAYFERTISFESPSDQESFYFRVTAGKEIKKINATTYQQGSLTVEIPDSFKAFIREGDPAELLLEIKLDAGKTPLTFKYHW